MKACTSTCDTSVTNLQLELKISPFVAAPRLGISAISALLSSAVFLVLKLRVLFPCHSSSIGRRLQCSGAKRSVRRIVRLIGGSERTSTKRAGVQDTPTIITLTHQVAAVEAWEHLKEAARLESVSVFDK